jgi:hypothetical protein
MEDIVTPPLPRPDWADRARSPWIPITGAADRGNIHR